MSNFDKPILKASLLLGLIFMSFKICAQDIQIQTLKEAIKNQPYFSIYGDNYFVTGSPINEKISSNNSDVKFEIGFKQRLSNLVLPFKTYGYLTYRQKSFWHVYKESAPFTETNYNPGFGLAKPIVNKENKVTQAYFFQFEHQSNGRDSIFSRSWNYLSLQYILMHKENWQFGLKVWAPLGPLRDNRDLLDYIGYQETSVVYMPSKRIILETKIRKPFKFDLKGSVQLSLSFKFDKDANQYIYVQYYLGYAESLIDYNKNVSMIRVGITFKDLFGNLSRFAD